MILIKGFLTLSLFILGLFMIAKGSQEININQCKIIKDFYIPKNKVVITTKDMNKQITNLKDIICKDGKALLKVEINHTEKIIELDEIFKINDIEIEKLILSKVSNTTMEGIIKIILGVSLLILLFVYRNVSFKKPEKSLIKNS